MKFRAFQLSVSSAVKAECKARHETAFKAEGVAEAITLKGFRAVAVRDQAATNIAVYRKTGVGITTIFRVLEHFNRGDRHATVSFSVPEPTAVTVR